MSDQAPEYRDEQEYQDGQYQGEPADAAGEDAEPRSTHEVVEHGDTVHDFADRHGVAVEDLVRFNEATLAEEARARGFEPTFFRQGEVEYRVIPGTRLRVREDDEEPAR